MTAQHLSRGDWARALLVILIWGLLFTEDHGAPGWVPKAWVALKLPA